MSRTAFILSASAFILFFLTTSLVFAQPPEPTAPEDSSPMVEKNLFSPDRKPPAPGSQSSAGDQKGDKTPPTAVQLDGVFIYGDKKSALLRLKSPTPSKKKGDHQESPYVTVAEGEQVGDMRVVKIEARKITLEREGEIQEVDLFETNKVSPPVQAPPKVQPATAPQEQQPAAENAAAESQQPSTPENAKRALTAEERRARRQARLQQREAEQAAAESGSTPPEPNDNAQEGNDQPEPPAPVPPPQQ